MVWIQDKIYESGTRRVQKKKRKLENDTKEEDIKILELDELEDMFIENVELN